MTTVSGLDPQTVIVRPMRSVEASRIQFSSARGLFAAGYDPEPIDRLIRERIVPTLRAYEKGVAGITIRAAELEDAKFQLSRRGYQVTEVDEFLDRVAAQLELYESV